jgi:hypothetical protein
MAFGLMIAVATSAMAQSTPPQTATPPATAGKDPNRIICEKEDTIGSRLGGTKVCKTWLEWQQQRAEHRESIERIQQNSNVGKPGG